MKRSAITEIICSLLILLFSYTAISKLADRALFQSQLINFPMLGRNTAFFSWIIPLIELCVAFLLLVPASRLYGLYASAMILFLFTLFLLLMMSFSKRLPCSCGGVIALLSWKQHIAFNLFFLSLAVIGIYLEQQITGNAPAIKTRKPPA